VLTRVILVGVGLVLGQALIVAALAALRPRGNVYTTIVLVALATAPLAVAGDRLLFDRTLSVDGRVFLGLLHVVLGGAFFHFMTLPDRSVTLRILAELERSPDRTLSVEALQRRYGVREMIVSRLDQLAAGRFLEIGADGALTLLPRGATFGRFVAGGRRLFRIASAN
jgi:hypothetical protein